jgi:cyclic pyranopterin phosphate synthase
MDVRDTFGRPLRDLRISVTDRCNFRCRYCMPREVFGSDYEFLRRDQHLTYEEIARVAAATVELGVRKVRLTGGEPLLRRDLHVLVGFLAPMIDDLTLTTNGVLLPKKAPELAAAGLHRLTVSLDSLDDEVFRAMNDADAGVDDVLVGLEAAVAAGLGPIKVNAVVQKGVNDHTVVDLAGHFRGTGHVVRFIEYMDVGTTNGWRMDHVVPSAEVVAAIGARWPLEAVEPAYSGEVARRWRYTDGSGEIGVISSVTEPFCGDCTRLRLSAEGVLYTCLFASSGVDLRTPLRDGIDDDELRSLVVEVWSGRADRYSELRSAGTAGWEKVEMSYIGG